MLHILTHLLRSRNLENKLFCWWRVKEPLALVMKVCWTWMIGLRTWRSRKWALQTPWNENAMNYNYFLYWKLYLWYFFMNEMSINFPPHFIGIWCPRLRMENWSCGTVTVRTKSMLYRWDRRGWWPVPTPHQEVLWPAEVSTIFAPFTGNYMCTNYFVWVEK